ncbi:hypothetical protein P618_201128 [Holospora obtusa F1]|uniref:Uncharacterized protein n=1 Tax=Holospora obtusa F1 TaxID=1399147 RepID=W6TSA8_HOLOB|nr:hypothetical protein [Holospora obtusa]ETZ06722.1 hypothetical protein P618_201128 [Holospora obtusa F1]
MLFLFFLLISQVSFSELNKEGLISDIEKIDTFLAQSLKENFRWSLIRDFLNSQKPSDIKQVFWNALLNNNALNLNIGIGSAGFIECAHHYANEFVKKNSGNILSCVKKYLKNHGEAGIEWVICAYIKKSLTPREDLKQALDDDEIFIVLDKIQHFRKMNSFVLKISYGMIAVVLACVEKCGWETAQELLIKNQKIRSQFTRYDLIKLFQISLGENSEARKNTLRSKEIFELVKIKNDKNLFECFVNYVLSEKGIQDKNFIENEIIGSNKNEEYSINFCCLFVPFIENNDTEFVKNMLQNHQVMERILGGDLCKILCKFVANNDAEFAKDTIKKILNNTRIMNEMGECDWTQILYTFINHNHTEFAKEIWKNREIFNKILKNSFHLSEILCAFINNDESDFVKETLECKKIFHEISNNSETLSKILCDFIRNGDTKFTKEILQYKEVLDKFRHNPFIFKRIFCDFIHNGESEFVKEKLKSTEILEIFSKHGAEALEKILITFLYKEEFEFVKLIIEKSSISKLFSEKFLDKLLIIFTQKNKLNFLDRSKYDTESLLYKKTNQFLEMSAFNAQPLRVASLKDQR